MTKVWIGVERAQMKTWRWSLPILAVFAWACAQAPPSVAPAWAQFQSPEQVTIAGYDGDAMEPFLSRDGAVLFFNNSNEPPEQTDIHWAERIDDLNFRYRGRVEGATSETLDGVPTMSAAGRFCFVSPRRYEETLATIYCGAWADGELSAPQLQTDVSVHIRGRLVFDVELTATADALVLADGVFRGGPMPAAADLRLARSRDGAFHLSPGDDALFANLNTDALEYAAGLSANGLLIAFTRAEGLPPFVRTSVWIARRGGETEAFGAPVRIEAITGAIVEEPTFAPDSRAIYYHRRTGDRLAIWRVSQ
jgi:hypothetical protein